MKRLISIFVATGLVSIFEGAEPAFARFHRDAPMGFSLWQIFIGGFLLLVLFSIFAGGGGQSKESIEKEKKENKERIEREKEKKGLLKYYGEGAGIMLLYWLALPILACILGGIFWLFS